MLADFFFFFFHNIQKKFLGQIDLIWVRWHFIYLFIFLLSFGLGSMDSLSAYFYYFVSKKQPYVENFTLIQIWQLQFSHAFKNFATVNWHDKFFFLLQKISILPFPFDCEWHHNWAELSVGGLHVLLSYQQNYELVWYQ